MTHFDNFQFCVAMFGIEQASDADDVNRGLFVATFALQQAEALAINEEWDQEWIMNPFQEYVIEQALQHLTPYDPSRTPSADSIPF